MALIRVDFSLFLELPLCRFPAVLFGNAAMTRYEPSPVVMIGGSAFMSATGCTPGRLDCMSARPHVLDLMNALAIGMNRTGIGMTTVHFLTHF